MIGINNKLLVITDVESDVQLPFVSVCKNYSRNIFIIFYGNIYIAMHYSTL